MALSSSAAVLAALLCLAAAAALVDAAETVTCYQPTSPCYKKTIYCPGQCPYTKPSNPGDKACVVDCQSYLCEATCQVQAPNCNGNGAGCYDPRFIGGDGVVFYFHGRKGEHFALVSDQEFQINARFIGHRPAGRPRDFTWIQALGLLIPGGNRLTLEATRAVPVWNDAIDYLRFSFNGAPLDMAEGYRSKWSSPDGRVAMDRTEARNAVTVVVDGIVEMSVGVVPVTDEDNRVHNYHIPSGDSYPHLEVQFKSLKVSNDVDGVIGRTYRPGYVNAEAKPGVEMPVVGGEDEYRTSSLLSPKCKRCTFRSDSTSHAQTPEKIMMHVEEI